MAKRGKGEATKVEFRGQDDASPIRTTLRDSSNAVSGPPRQLLAAKLRLTSLALNCATHKEICARFSTVNSQTAFTPQNSYKWLGGKATPRLSSVYSDWAAVLGGHLTPAFIAASTFVEFAEALGRSHVLPEAAISRLSKALEPVDAVDKLTSRPVPPPPFPSQWSTHHVLTGRYLALSPAWSPLVSGRLAVGHVEIRGIGGNRSSVTYTENLFDRILLLSGEMVADERYAQAIMHADFARRAWILNLHLPAFPASLLTGLLDGSAVIDFDGRLLTSRILLIRDYNDGAIGSLPAYADPDPNLIAEWLALLGYHGGDERISFARKAIEFVLRTRESPLIDVPPEDQRALGLILDKLAPLEDASLSHKTAIRPRRK